MNIASTHEFLNGMQQWVCLQCGYNMIGEMPDVCPFCGAKHDRFMTWDEVEKTYQVTAYPVNDTVSQLLSVPKLGLEHAAYRIETEAGAVWMPNTACRHYSTSTGVLPMTLTRMASRLSTSAVIRRALPFIFVGTCCLSAITCF